MAVLLLVPQRHKPSRDYDPVHVVHDYGAVGGRVLPSENFDGLAIRIRLQVCRHAALTCIEYAPSRAVVQGRRAAVDMPDAVVDVVASRPGPGLGYATADLLFKLAAMLEWRAREDCYGDNLTWYMSKNQADLLNRPAATRYSRQVLATKKYCSLTMFPPW